MEEMTDKQYNDNKRTLILLILEHCENPKSPEFVNAVSARKETKRLLDTLTDAL